MKQTTGNSEMVSGRGGSGASETAALNMAVRAAFRIYEYRGLERNLRTFGWRGARRRTLGNGTLSGEWVRRGGCEVRLARKGLEVHLTGEQTRLLSWQELWEHAREKGP
jgi:hypothetical protein